MSLTRSSFLMLAPVVLFGFDIEPKRPLAPSQELRIRQDDRSIVVSGETFDYTFSKTNGLMADVQVLGRRVSDGTPIPDLWTAEQLDPSFSPYRARHESQARVTLEEGRPDRIVIRSEGAYTSEDGRRFGLRYSLRYEITIDGVTVVELNNTAAAACSMRWLALSAGAMPERLARFLNWMPEQSTAQTTRYQFRSLADQDDGDVLSGTWFPWIWMGDQQVGLEVTTWDVSSQTYSQLDSTTRKDQPAMFAVRKEHGRVRWDNYLIRRTRVVANPGWSRGGAFALAVTPSKKFDPYFALLKGSHLGPHQHVTDLTLPTEDQIRTLARNGGNLIVGMANWRSGEYVPLNEAGLRRTIELCHRYGVKIIPYMTLVDLSHATETFRRHGEEWAIEPTTEFIHHLRRDWNAERAYRNDPEEETTLMCPGGAGWRSHWKQQVDRVIRDYDFDGIYFDFWYGRMACENARHGCGGRFRKGTVLGSREMLMYAYNRLKAKNPRAIIKANTNTLATALITSLVDIRLVGESIDASSMDPDSRQWLYSSFRLGQPTEFLWDRRGWNAVERRHFATLINFLPKYYERLPFEPREAFDDFDVYRSFDDATGSWMLGIGGQDRLRARQPEVVINVVERGPALMATLVNTGAAEITAEVPVEAGWRAFEPLGERVVEINEGVLRVTLEASGYRHVLLWKETAEPRVLYALGGRSPASQTLDSRSRRLRFEVDAVPGARVRFAVAGREALKSVADTRGGAVPFEWNAQTGMARFEIIYEPGKCFEATY